MSRLEDEDLEPLRELAGRFAEKELAPRWAEHDDYPAAPFHRAAVTRAAEVGLLTILQPEERGGGGQGMRGLCVILEALAQVDAGFAALVLVNALGRSAVDRWARTPQTPRPETLTAFPAYSLPEDPGGALEARKTEGGYRLQGTAEYVPLAPVASSLVLPARVRDGGSCGFFRVDASQEGVALQAPLLSLGLRSCPVADVRLDGAAVPEEALLCGDAAAGFSELAAAFRPAVAALALGVLSASLRAAGRYAQERVQGGRAIAEHDMVRLMLADMALAEQTGRVLLREMAAAADRGAPAPCSRAGWLLVTERAARATGDGVQVLGGYGYMQDYGQEKRMRDAKQIESLFGGPVAGRLRLASDVLARQA